MLPDIDIRDIPESILTICNRNSRIVTKLFDKKFRDADCPINATQYDLLRMIWVNQGQNAPSVSKNAGMDRTTIFRRLEPLIKLGYARIDNVAKDKRIKLLQITTAGMKILKLYAKTYIDADRELEFNIESIRIDSI